MFLGLFSLWHAVSSPTTLSSRGSQVPSMKPSVELAQRDAAVQLSCASVDSRDDLQPISLFDMLGALQVRCFTRCISPFAFCLHIVHFTSLPHPATVADVLFLVVCVQNNVCCL